MGLRKQAWPSQRRVLLAMLTISDFDLRAVGHSRRVLSWWVTGCGVTAFLTVVLGGAGRTRQRRAEVGAELTAGRCREAAGSRQLQSLSPSLPGTLLNQDLESGTRRGAESPLGTQCSGKVPVHSRTPGCDGNSGFSPASLENRFPGSQVKAAAISQSCLTSVSQTLTLTLVCGWDLSAWAPVDGVTLSWRPRCSGRGWAQVRDTNIHAGCLAHIT